MNKILRRFGRLLPVVATLAIAAIVAAACSSGETTVEPPEIQFGEDVCVECNMIISDPRFASAYVHEVEPGRYDSSAFDDIGDMLVHADKNPDHAIAAWYVHDYDSEDWVDATQAHYVFSFGLKTPMAQGTAAHTTLAAAEAMAADLNGEVLDWEGLRAKHALGELTTREAGQGHGHGGH